MATTPLFGLLEDALFPGEERTLGPPALDAGHLRALGKAVGSTVAFVTITSPHELPSLVAGRHATRAEVLRADGEGFLVRGVGRARIAKATRAEPPFQAELEPAPADPAAAARLLAGVKSLAAVLGSGAEAEGGPQRVEDAAAALLRSALPAEDLPRLQRLPLAEALEEAAALVKGRRSAFEAEAALEDVVKALASADAQSPQQKRRLWSRVIELQKKLDVYDPAATTDGDDLTRLEKRLRQAGLPPAAREFAKRELKLLRAAGKGNNEHSTYLSHLELMARLPWHAGELPPVDLGKVQATLDRDHAGMEKVKRRILESLAVRVLGGSSQSMVLCLVGPPGTGKTTIARSIAEALGRPFARVALGGVHDECELRGHRPTFVASSAGRVIQALASAGSQNALVLLDEIDKLGSDKSRSPMGALLELLDPAQHHEFSDHFLQVPYDLSHVLFVCTANDASQIHPVLFDRLEQVELDGYGVEEKVRLVRSHLLPRVVKELALGAVPEIADEVLVGLIEGHTREAGLRQLQRALASILRARALAKVKDGADVSGPVTREETEKVLGRGRAPRKLREDALPVGTAYGLSVSSDGGALLPVEVVRLKGRGRLHLTGQLGNVLKESARAALSHLRHESARYGLDPAAFDDDLHVHLPDGATPKDGPSAGIALAVAIASAASGRAVRADVAFSGEITLSGRVTAVGGVRAKVLAAERAGMAEVCLPADNATDVPDALRLRIVAVSSLEEVLRAAFAQGPSTHAAGVDPALGPAAAAHAA